MAHKYDAAKSKKFRLQFLAFLIAGPVGYTLTANLIIPTTPLEENLWVIAKIGFLLWSLIAVVGLSLNLLSELIHEFEHDK